MTNVIVGFFIMKKITDFERYHRNQLRAQKRFARYLSQRHTHGAFGKIHLFRPVEEPVIPVSAPRIFSLMENPEEVLSFIAALSARARRDRPLFIDLMNVERISPEAVLLLLSTIKSRRLKKCLRIGGNEPRDPEVSAALSQSGFYSYVTHKPKGHRSDSTTGIMKKHEGKKVREDICAQLVQHATKAIYGKVTKNGGLYRALIECMANTRDHASVEGKEQEAWWVSVHCNAEAKTADFAFLDNGVGIFKSIKWQNFTKRIAKSIFFTDQSSLLNDLLHAHLGSRTELPYRGKGLPAILKAQQRGQITNLRLITNKAYLDATSGVGRVIKQEFKGTCLTWRIQCE
ncbi:MAG: hypothetical protein HY302_11000 [Opitutae bacterium]|nr:hypothetical protein [Opitutae bacterium]